MNIIAVDDEQFALELSEQAIREALPDCKLSCFVSPNAALAYAKDKQVDIAFLDIEMGSMNGIVLAKMLKEIYGRTNIVFVTGYSEYALESYTMLDTSDYLLKPITKELVLRAINRLRDPVEIVTGKRVRIQTFGNFEVFVDDEPLMFLNSKTKELLAYLVDRRGAICNINEIIAVIWEEKLDTPSLKSHFRNLVADLMQMLKSKGIDDILIKKHGHLGLKTDGISCDVYDFTRSIPYAVNSYMGEYMKQYPWAEFTNAYLGNSK